MKAATSKTMNRWQVIAPSGVTIAEFLLRPHCDIYIAALIAAFGPPVKGYAYRIVSVAVNG